MRCAVLSDVHANLHALQAVLAVCDVDLVVCAGDLVGYGAHPNECVDLLREHGAVCVAGNHELMALGRLSSDKCTPLAQTATRWTRSALRGDVRDYLDALPLQRTVGRMLVTHGSVGDPEEYVRQPVRAQELLAGLPAGVDRLVLGHTHEPWVHAERAGTLLRREAGRRLVDERLLVNPGSVGQSRDACPDARYALVDLHTAAVELAAVPYDVEAARAGLRAAGLPEEAYHCRAALVRRLAGRARSRVLSRSRS